MYHHVFPGESRGGSKVEVKENFRAPKERTGTSYRESVLWRSSNGLSGFHNGTKYF